MYPNYLNALDIQKKCAVVCAKCQDIFSICDNGNGAFDIDYSISASGDKGGGMEYSEALKREVRTYLIDAFDATYRFWKPSILKTIVSSLTIFAGAALLYLWRGGSTDAKEELVNMLLEYAFCVVIVGIIAVVLTFIWNLWMAPYRLMRKDYQALTARVCAAEASSGEMLKTVTKAIKDQTEANCKSFKSLKREIEPEIEKAAINLVEPVRDSCRGTTGEALEAIRKMEELMKQVRAATPVADVASPSRS
jgi:hypothetical protein